MNVDTSFAGKPWQNALVGSRNKLNALFNDGYISDLTITFPGNEISYKAHKVILAMSSSIFERILYGPMAVTGSELDLPDDNPAAFKIVLAHCYDVSIEPSDIDEALEVYMLADKYFMEELSRKCSYNICSMFNSTVNIEKVLEFSNNFNFDSLKEDFFEHVMESPDILHELSQALLKKVLESSKDISELVFVGSWQNPKETLQEDNIIQILKSKNCRSPGITKFSGCVSAKVVSNICWAGHETFIKLRLNLSFTNVQQANEIISLLYNMKYRKNLSIHLQCKMIPADRLGKILTLPCPFYNNTKLFLSNVDNNGIDWVVTAICSLKPLDESLPIIYFPSSKLTLRGLKILLKKMEVLFDDNFPPGMLMCSSNIPSNKNDELYKWIELNIENTNIVINIDLYDSNEHLGGGW